MNRECNRAEEVAPCPRSPIGKGAFVPKYNLLGIFENLAEHASEKIRRQRKIIQL